MQPEKYKPANVCGSHIRYIEAAECPIEYSAAAKVESPDSVVRVIQKCGHWPQMENPERVNPMLISFLKGASVPEVQKEF